MLLRSLRRIKDHKGIKPRKTRCSKRARMSNQTATKIMADLTRISQKCRSSLSLTRTTVVHMFLITITTSKTTNNSVIEDLKASTSKSLPIDRETTLENRAKVLHLEEVIQDMVTEIGLETTKKIPMATMTTITSMSLLRTKEVVKIEAEIKERQVRIDSKKLA